MSQSPSAMAAPAGAPSLDPRDECARRFIASLTAAPPRAEPFPHRLLADVLPGAVVAGLTQLPWAAPELGGRSGARELHNDTRRYLDPALIAASPLCAAVAQAFQSTAVVSAVQQVMAVDLTGCFLRIEYAQDTDGFWLAPHTDLGVKRFTLLAYLAPAGRDDLGTDLYDEAQAWAQRPAFAPGAALAFVPSDRSWHGFEPRPIGCVRKSLIVNYVTDEWRAREQLAFPEAPVAGRSAHG